MSGGNAITFVGYNYTYQRHQQCEYEKNEIIYKKIKSTLQVVGHNTSKSIDPYMDSEIKRKTSVEFYEDSSWLLNWKPPADPGDPSLITIP